MGEELAGAVKSFLKQDPILNSIGGKWVKGAKDEVWDVFNPSDGSLLARTALGTSEDVNAAVEAAQAAFGKWSRMAPNDRAVLIHRLADLMERDFDTLAQLESLDVGKALVNSEGFDIPFGIECVRYFADLSTRATYSVPLPVKNMEARSVKMPYGVCGFIFPWNFPFDLFQWGVMPALAAGNTVVVKPSELTPLTTLYMAKLAEEAGIPAGVINVVVGTGPVVGEALARHPLVRRMSFTGSPGVGKTVGGICGERLIPCKLELGGKGAAVVFDDVDVNETAAGLAGAITLNTGQVCCTATRWIIHEKIYDDFVSKVTEVLKNVKIGPGINRATEMGPVVSLAQQDRILGYYEKGVKQGARVLLGGGLTEVDGVPDGYYVKPHLLEGEQGNICFREEIFGPTAFLTKFRGEEDAVQQVNSLSYGLANSVWTADLKRAARVAEQMISGNSWINAHNLFAYGLPYGGCNLSGTGGGVNSPETFMDYLRSQTIARPL
jgi:aldehyde dehydrogenase (NAD+)